MFYILFSLQGSGTQVALIAVSSVSHLTRENENSVPCEGGRNWETGKTGGPGKYRKNQRSRQMMVPAGWVQVERVGGWVSGAQFSD